MIVGRIFGWLVFLVGLVVLTRDGLVWLYTGLWTPLPLGQLWFALNPASFNIAQAIMQGRILSFLWNSVIADILVCWAFAVLMIVGLGVVYLFGFRERRWL